MTDADEPLVDDQPDLRPRSYRVVLPPQWWAIDLDPERSTASVNALLRRQFAGIDDAPDARVKVAAYLMERVEAARAADGLELYLSTFRTGPIVIPAALLVSYSPGLETPVELEEFAEVLATSESASSVRAVDVLQLPAGPAIRRLAYRVEVGDPDAEPIPSINLDWHIPVPSGRGAMLSLSFATSLVTLEDALLELFDAIASTFEWVW